MADTRALGSRQVGWCYSQAGTPCAVIYDLDDPGGAMVIPHDNWWTALRFALTFAQYNGAEYVGGPGQ